MSIALDAGRPPLTDDVGLTVSISTENGHSVVHVAGELDLSTRNRLFGACLAGDHVAVVVEMADVTFMDCGGYGALVATRLVLEERGGSLTLRNPAGQPAHLLSLLSLLELVS